MLADRFVVLDRDGVINEDSDDYIKSPLEWVPIPGSLGAITKLTRAGFGVAVVTNQSGIARGLLNHSLLNAIHEKLAERVVADGGRVEMLLFCPHGPAEGCGCRKPKHGLLIELSRRAGIQLRGVPFVGDSISDVRAARRADMTPMLVRTGKGRRTLAANQDELLGVRVFADLSAAVDFLVDG